MDKWISVTCVVGFEAFCRIRKIVIVLHVGPSCVVVSALPHTWLYVYVALAS
jgi:hypothetical protein